MRWREVNRLPKAMQLVNGDAQEPGELSSLVQPGSVCTDSRDRKARGLARSLPLVGVAEGGFTGRCHGEFFLNSKVLRARSGFWDLTVNTAQHL